MQERPVSVQNSLQKNRHLASDRKTQLLNEIMKETDSIQNFRKQRRQESIAPSLMQKSQALSVVSKGLNKSVVTYEAGKGDQLRQKLAYEWKNIFRGLSLQDNKNVGRVGKRAFETTVHQNGVFLSREELLYLYARFSANE